MVKKRNDAFMHNSPEEEEPFESEKNKRDIQDNTNANIGNPGHCFFILHVLMDSGRDIV